MKPSPAPGVVAVLLACAVLASEPHASAAVQTEEEKNADTAQELINANITTVSTGGGSAPELLALTGQLPSNLRAFAKAMQGKTYNKSNPGVGGVQIRWGRDSSSTLGPLEIAIATSEDEEEPSAKASSTHAKCSTYASCGKSTGGPATAESTGTLSNAFAVAGNSSNGDGGEGGSAVSLCSKGAATALAGDGGSAGGAGNDGGRGGHAIAVGSPSEALAGAGGVGIGGAGNGDPGFSVQAP